MRPAYIHVVLDDSEENNEPFFFVSPCPFLYRQGELLLPANLRCFKAETYSALCVVLTDEFHIPPTMLPSPEYFKPSQAEQSDEEDEEQGIYRIVPEGAGEPVWRTKARQALLDALDELDESFIFGEGKVRLNGKDYFSIEEIADALLAIAQAAGGRARTEEEPYQPDYDVLVKEALGRDEYLIKYSGLRKKRKHNS